MFYNEGMDRAILHSDANAFYASVEAVLHPELKGLAVAVCGAAENRHGIVLAKSELAKRAGVKTGMTNREAKRLCPELVLVPPHHEIYEKFSRRLRGIYERYTDRVEAYGLDECWLDVTGCRPSPRAIAEEIRAAVKAEIGITVSVGVSFNKVFAKLGSDMKKPDAVTEITRADFKQTVWKLPCSDLLFCGRATTEKLKTLGIFTIGDLANASKSAIVRRLGKNGEMLWKYANGQDDSPVLRIGEEEQVKSVGHGVTCVADLENIEEANVVLIALTQEIGQKLRSLGLQARGVQVTVRDRDLMSESWQQLLREPTQCAADLSKAGKEILKTRYGWKKPIRSLTIGAIHLESVNEPRQLSLFRPDDRQRRVEGALDRIRDKFGSGAIKPAALLGENKLPEESPAQAPPPGGIGHP